MKIQLLVPWWALIPFVAVTIVVVWQLWRIRHEGKAMLLRWGRRVALLLLPILMALGLSIPGGSSAIGTANLDVIFAVDTTPSMGALDYKGAQQRIVGIRSDLLALAAKLQGARFEIITFDSSANLILPFTNDVTTFQSAVQGLAPDVNAYSEGTTLDKPVSYISQELSYSKSSGPERKRLLFYLSDGEQTTGTTVGSFASIQPNINGGSVLGYGTAKGAQIVKYAGPGEVPSPNSYVLTVDPATKKLSPVISKIDPSHLQTIAKQLKVNYEDRNQGGSIDSAYTASKAPLSIDNSQHIVHYVNLYWLFAIPFVLLVFWEWQTLIITVVRLRRRHGGKHHE